MKGENIYTIPNLLSLYRLLSFPFVLYLAISGNEQLYAIFLVINLITDALDGIIARTFRLQTELGARLDALADVGMYISAITGVFVFKAADFAAHLLSLYVYIGVFAGSVVISLFKFGRFPSLHLYSSKIGGYLQGIFFFVLFVFGFDAKFYYFVIIWAILAFCEQICVQWTLSEPVSNAKGLYWVLKYRNKPK
jgi:CDP-diacylglycerol--glycerol-3-phosphate 3-phosphatidyltransferase